MINKNVLVIGRHQTMMYNVKRILEQEGYTVYNALQNEEAFDVFNNNSIDAVIIGGGVDNESRILFHNYFATKITEYRIIDAHPSTVLVDLENAFKKS
ncbi:MAG: hypothetical protein ACOVO1_03175 [Chitinophagaceae bacterium]|jgi:CheY-like chemotaxis protein